jgi:ubiquinone/menaquinone biosynthesis C-methylase UbiE
MKEINTTSKEHWQKVYTRDEATLGWYQKEASASLQMIENCQLDKNARIIDVGSGASVMLDNLLDLGYNQLTASDISSKGLQKSQERLGEKANKITWIVDDLCNPKVLSEIEQVDLWHDRAVLHFFTEEKDRQTYFELLDKKVKKGGQVILAVFNTQTAKKCSGLVLKQYDKGLLCQFLGQGYELLEHFNYDYTMPSGDVREYIYTRFRKI